MFFERVSITTLTGINGLHFGATSAEVEDRLGAPDRARENYTGELEMLYADCIVRLFADRFVEATFPDDRTFLVNGVAVLSMYDWLRGRPDTVDRARFRISTSTGIAYDNRDPAQGSVTVFEQGRWDSLLLQA